MDQRTQEILDILQEECGELIVDISKIRRFGLKDNRERLIQEIGDITCMIDLLIDQGILNVKEIAEARDRKKEKLKVWSNIFTSEAKSADLKFTTAQEYMKSSYRTIKEIAE